jgi:hypothetical protein
LPKEIGGYFELETYGEPPLRDGGIALNSGRNCLRYIIRAYDIKELYVPYYTCPVVWSAIKEEGCAIRYYEIDEHFLPITAFHKDSYVLYNNWFGTCGEQVQQLASTYPLLIVDNAQSYYSDPCGMASFYSPRKFFGVPDGGVLYCDKQIDAALETDMSFDRVLHLLKRFDMGASAGYEDFKNNDRLISRLPMMGMSALTTAMMQNVNHVRTRKIRNDNYQYLWDRLQDANELELSRSIDAPMVYPLLVHNAALRENLIEAKVYVAKYWDGIERAAPADSRAIYLRDYLLPLPIDQRYTVDDMERIAQTIKTPKY